jgi:hypothetical protein
MRMRGKRRGWERKRENKVENAECYIPSD